MGIFVSVWKIIESIAGAVVFAALFLPCFYKSAGILQSLGYDGRKLFAWAKKKGNLLFTRHLLLSMLAILACAVISLCFCFAGEWSAVAGLASYVIFFVLYVWADSKIALRSPATPTARFKRLYAVLAVIVLALIWISFTLLNFADYAWGNKIFAIFRYCALGLFPLLIIPLTAFANLIAKIYEVPHNKSFVKTAKAKLESSSIRVVGITGSYGKTSAKQILSAILSKKYRVLATPRSHNTPLGLALTVNNNNLSDYDVLIAEMGARNIGDIAELCEICPPDFSMITGICPQHLESFGSVENIVKAKSEILDFTKVSAVIADDCFEMFAATNTATERVCPVSGVKCSPDGTQFTIEIDGERKEVKTKLLGRHSAENIALAATLAHTMGMTAEEIAAAIPEIDFVEHRLQLIKSGEVNILDDGYNSNVKGAAAALEVLKSFEGRKIVVTPGLVELGILEETENMQLGAALKDFDLVILVGDTLITPVKEGYKANGGDMGKLITAPTLFAAQEHLKGYLAGGDTVLFLNDLPDIY